MPNDKFDSKSFNPQAFKYMVGRVPNLHMHEIKKSKALAGNPDIKAKVNEILGVDTTPKKSVDEIAQEVINGAWGNGQDRKNRIEQAGYDYTAVQNKVNELCGTPKKSIDEIARAVIRGEYGNGADRKNRITAEGYDYAAVQARVNDLM